MIRSSALYSAGLMLENVCSLLSGFFVAKLLGPYVQGIWQTARLCRSYAEFSTLGQALGMRRQVAVATGQNALDEIEQQRDTSFVWNTFSLLLIGIGVAVFACLAPIEQPLRMALLAIAAALALTGIMTFLNLWFKTTERFGVLAASAVVAGIANLAVIVLLFLFGFNGLLVGYVLISAAVVALLVYFYREPIRLRFSMDAFKSSLAVGFPLFLVGITSMFFTSVDRLVVIARMGFSDMGFYSVATMCFMPVQTVISSVAVVLLPRVCQHYGLEGNADGLRHYYQAPLSILMITLPAVACVAALCMPALIHTLLPDYASGIVPAQTMLIGLSFASASGFFHNVILAAEKQWWMVLTKTIGCLVKLILAWCLIGMGHGLVGVAGATSLSYVVEFGLLFFIASKITKNVDARKIRLLWEAVIATLAAVMVWYVMGGDIRLLWAADQASHSALMGLILILLILIPVALSWRRMKHMLDRS